MKARDPIVVAIISLVLGSIATPLIYLASAWWFPSGFADLREASGQTFVYYFVAVWLASALATALIGGSTWRFLHRRKWDGFASYAAIGAGAALLISLVIGVALQNWLSVLMAASNGLAVRAIERAIRYTPTN